MQKLKVWDLHLFSGRFEAGIFHKDTRNETDFITKAQGASISHTSHMAAINGHVLVSVSSYQFGYSVIGP